LEYDTARAQLVHVAVGRADKEADPDRLEGQAIRSAGEPIPPFEVERRSRVSVFVDLTIGPQRVDILPRVDQPAEDHPAERVKGGLFQSRQNRDDRVVDAQAAVLADRVDGIALESDVDPF